MYDVWGMVYIVIIRAKPDRMYHFLFLIIIIIEYIRIL